MRQLYLHDASGRPIRQVTTGGFHTCGIAADGRAYCWGFNGGGQLGDGTRENRAAPTAVRGNRTWLDVDAGLLHTCAVTRTNDAYCWGYNDEGQLGIGTQGFSQVRSAPKLVLGGKSFKSVALGGGFSCGLTTNGAAWCWGGNASGQLGDGSTSPRLTPARVSGRIDFALLAAGFDQACGVGVNGTGWCWGDNLWGELGDGTTNASAVPVRVAAPM